MGWESGRPQAQGGFRSSTNLSPGLRRRILDSLPVWSGRGSAPFGGDCSRSAHYRPHERDRLRLQPIKSAMIGSPMDYFSLRSNSGSSLT